MNREKLEYYAHLTTAAVGVLLACYLVFKYALPLLLPFIVAFCVARAVEPLAEAVSERTRVPVRAVSATLCVVIVAGLLAAIVSIIAYALSEAWSLLRGLLSSGALERALERVLSLLPSGEGGAAISEYIVGAVKGALTSLLSSVASAVTSLAGGLPRVLIFILVSVAATLYFSLDLKRISNFVSDIMPKALHGWLSRNKSRIFSSFLRYMRAYLFIMLVTFIEMLFGFLVVGIDYAVLLAFIVALLDALPLIGVGTLLLPIAAYNLLFANRAVAVGLLVIFIVHTVIRQVIEPRIVGKNLGIHPIVSLLLLYVGYTLLGAVGIILVPIISVLLNAVLNKDDAPEIADSTSGK